MAIFLRGPAPHRQRGQSTAQCQRARGQGASRKAPGAPLPPGLLSACPRAKPGTAPWTGSPWYHSPSKIFQTRAFGRAASWRCPSCGTKSIPYGKSTLAPLVQKVQGFLQNFCNSPAVSGPRTGKCASFQIGPLAGPGGRQTPGSGNSSNKLDASIKLRRLMPGATTLRTRTRRSSAIVRTSPGPTPFAGVSIRRALRRTPPPVTSRAARLRVLATRANHSHLSSRWRSATP